MEKTPEELFKERIKRVEDAIQLKVPDRVPITPFFGFFSAKYAGVTCEELMYDYDKLGVVERKTILDFQPDMYVNPYTYALLGPLMEALDYKELKWPGHGVSPTSSYQFVEGEYMKADEYDAFLFDPSDWILRTYLPRTCGALEPLQQLFPFRQFHYYMATLGRFSVFGLPEVATAIESLLKAGREALKMVSAAASFDKEMKGLGFPPQFAPSTHAPFDALGDALRGTRGIMLDMYRQPDKLLEACEKLTPVMIEMGVSGAKRAGVPRVFIPLHKGPEGFMSLKQFKTFYWPGLKKIMEGLIDAGLTPCPLFEGNYTSRLEIISDIPKGKAVYHFECTDIFKAKEILGDRVCIRGNVPLSLLCTGTPEEVKDYCKKLIDVVGKDGGFIMDAGATLDDAKPENVKAMCDFTKEYGVYG